MVVSSPAVVRRAGSAPVLVGVTEHVGDFADESFTRTVTEGADAVVTTVHPMGSAEPPRSVRPTGATPAARQVGERQVADAVAELVRDHTGRVRSQ